MVRQRSINKVWIGIGSVILLGFAFWAIMLAVTSDKRNADMIVYLTDEYGYGGAGIEREYIKDADMARLIEATDFLKLPYNKTRECTGQDVVVELPQKYGDQSFRFCQIVFPSKMVEFLRERGYPVGNSGYPMRGNKS